jgi:hypothetical protein
MSALIFLVANAGHIMTRDELTASAWKGAAISDNSVVQVSSSGCATRSVSIRMAVRISTRGRSSGGSCPRKRVRRPESRRKGPNKYVWLSGRMVRQADCRVK